MKKILGISSKAIFFLIVIIGVFCVFGCSSKRFETETTKSFLAGDTSQAVKNANEWIASDHDNPVPHAILNIIYTYSDKTDLLKKELKLAYDSKEDLQKIIDWSSKLVKENQNNPHAYLLKGVAFEIYGDNQTAVTSYLKAIEVDSNFKQGYQSLGNLYFFNDQLQKALIVYSFLIKKYPNSSSPYCSVGLIFLKNDETEKAITYFEKAVELEPNDLVSLFNLANVYMDINAKEKAIIVLKRIIKLDPNGEIGEESKINLFKLQN